MSYMVWAQEDSDILAMEFSQSHETAIEIGQKMIESIGGDAHDWLVSNEYQDWKSGIIIRINDLSSE